MKLAPYPEYKDSGVAWIGRIPAHWAEMRAKYFFKEVDERSQTGEEEMLSVSHVTGVTPRSQKNVTMFKAESNAGHKTCRAGDLVINTMWAWMAAMGVAGQTGLVSPAYGVYRPKGLGLYEDYYLDRLTRIEGYRYEYLLRSTGIRSSRLRLYPDKFLSMPIVCPPRKEQEAIARFLKSQEYSFRKFIRNKRRLIGLLKEQNQNIINQAVTRGINPDVKLKPSGVEWLGNIPEHWVVRRVKTVCLLQRGYDLSADKFVNGKYPVYGSNGAIGFHNEFTTKAPCITIGRSGSVGKINFVETDFWAHNTALFVLNNHGNDWKWLHYFLTTLDVKKVSEGSAVPTLNRNLVHRLIVGMPPLQEQRETVEHIERALKIIDLAISRAEREIELMREYRARLISDVVTGKVDVRDIPVETVSDEDLLEIEEDAEELDDTPQDEPLEVAE